MTRTRFGAVAMAAMLAALPCATVQAETTIKVVKHASLRVLDPIFTTAYMSRNHGYMVYDTLFAWDDKFAAKPQMVKDHTVSADGLTYSFTLRDGLKFHDGAPVTAEDVVASIKRWGSADGLGQLLMANTADIKATGASSFTLTLKQKYGLVLYSLAKVSSNVPFIMPARFAAKPRGEQLGPAEQIGSGPFVFKVDEFEPGVKSVYLKFKDYVPRSEPAVWASGGKVVKVDRVEWINMPDQMTAANALKSGEIDYVEQLPHDLLPLVENEKSVKVLTVNKLGSAGMMRFNHLHKPFDNPKIRRAVAMAVKQEDYMKAMVGDPRFYSTCKAMFICGTPFATDAGSQGLLDGNIEAARKLLAEAGYDGTPVVVMQPTDLASVMPFAPVTVQAMRRIGLNVDMQSMDWQALVSRRAKQDPPAQGGWNMFHTTWVAADVLNPAMQLGLNGKGKNGGWFGWPEDAEIEKLRGEFALETDIEKQKAIATKVQERAYELGFYMPLGQYVQLTAVTDKLAGIIEAPAPFFWGIEKK